MAELEIKIKHHFQDMNSRPVGDAQADARGLEIFARALGLRLAQTRTSGRHGWHVKDTVSLESLEQKLTAQFAKGHLDPLDIAAFAMMVHIRRMMADEQARDVKAKRG